MAESGITKQALILLSKLPGVRVWLQPVRKMPDPYSDQWIQIGIPGMADISGIADGGLRLEIEMKKGKGHRNQRTIEAQARWRTMIEKHGGIYIRANTAKSAADQLSAELEKRRHERTHTG